jgi:hypothetical protein
MNSLAIKDRYASFFPHFYLSCAKLAIKCSFLLTSIRHKYLNLWQMKTNSTPLFRKTIPLVKSKLAINHSGKYAFMGSCFSQNIAVKFISAGLNVVDNPFGISFNPISLAHHLGVDNYDLLQVDELELSWQCHSSVYNKNEYQLNDLRNTYKDEISASAVVFVTFGSAWAYNLNETNRVVSNCHKQSADLFTKSLLSVEQIVSAWKKIIQEFPDQQFIFTVSPVRHWKDGPRENNVSKGILHQAIDLLIQDPNCDYYPSYEIVIDELRDYRFYSEDMLHPNKLAIDYIWRHFQKSYCTTETKELSSRINRLRDNLNHIPFHQSNDSFKAFQDKNLVESEELNRLVGRQVV